MFLFPSFSVISVVKILIINVLNELRNNAGGLCRSKEWGKVRLKILTNGSEGEHHPVEGHA